MREMKAWNGLSRRALVHASAVALTVAIGGCGLIKPPPPPGPPEEEFVTCSLSRTECSNWVEDDNSVIDEVNCPASAITTTTFTSSLCVSTTAGNEHTDAQAACNLFCSGNETTGGLYPLGFLEGPGSNVVCNATVSGMQQQNLTGLCTLAPTSPGATYQAQCTIGGRLCENIQATEDGTQFCSTMPETSVNFTKCFDPSKFLGENVCENGLQFPPGTTGSAPLADQFPWWRVTNVVPNGGSCGQNVAAATSYGIGAVTIGTAVAFGTTVPLVAKGGFMTTSVQCDPETEHCTTTVNDLQVQLADISAGGFTVRNPVARLVAPAAGPLGSIPAGGMTVQVEGDLALGHAVLVTSAAQPISVFADGTNASLKGQLTGVFNVSLQDVAPFSLSLNVSGSTTSPNAACSGETPQQQLLGFESLQDWSAGQGATVSLTADLRTQGCFGMQVGGSGFRTVNSSPFATPLAGTTSTLALDVYVPPNQPNQFWFGAVQLYLTCPSANFNNQFIGEAELSGKPVGQFSTVTYGIPGPIESMLQGQHPDCFFSLAVNMNQTPTPPVVDNLRFQ